MSILSSLFSSGAADLVKGVGGVIDNLHTSKEEKLEAEQKIKELIANYEVEMEKNITSRWEADLKSDSWLSKNVRPMTLIFLIVCTMLLIFIDAGAINFNVKDSYVDLLQMVLITVIGAYFGGRSFEKVKKNKMDIFKDNNDWNEKSIIGFVAFAIMCLIMVVDLVTGYMGEDLIINEFIYDSFVWVVLGCFGISGVEKFAKK